MSELLNNDRLRAVFAEVFEDPDFVLLPELKIGDVEVWDSFNQINLMLAIEAEFGVEFDSDEIGELTSVGAIVQAVERRVAADAS